jgi:hypothetical protein
MRFFLLTNVLTVALIAGFAEDARAYKLIGAGTSSCGAWTAHRRAYQPGGSATLGHQGELEDAQWVLGFLSGMGFVHKNDDDPLDGVDGEGVLAWIDNYCRANPIKALDDATTAFYFAHPHRCRCPFEKTLFLPIRNVTARKVDMTPAA